MIISILLLVGVTAVLFSGQFMSFYRTIQTRQIVASYEPLIERIQRNEYENIAELAQRFHEANQSFEFNIVDNNTDSIYATPNADKSNSFDGDFYFVVHKDKDFSIIAQSRTGLESFYRDLAVRVFVIFIVMFALCFICAYIFARRMTKPIKTLAYNTTKMAKLKEVPPLPERKDELGVLTNDIYSMYDKLKETISKMEEEILRERELEETQRHFFSAASHELKTPIAATSVLLEGMYENVGDYKDHSKYLRECMKMMDAQNKTVSEILEIVKLNDGKIIPAIEKIYINQIVTNILPNFQPLAETNNQHIIVNIPDEQACVIDPQMFERAFSNIVLNAIQNTPKDGEIRIWNEPTEDKYRLCVLNMGVKIDEDSLPKSFDPFYRVDKARNRKTGRSGLGLTIVRKTLESMNIQFDLENTSDGVLFWMDLQKA